MLLTIVYYFWFHITNSCDIGHWGRVYMAKNRLDNSQLEWHRTQVTNEIRNSNLNQINELTCFSEARFSLLIIQAL